MSGCLKILKNQLLDSNPTQKSGFLNGKGRAIKRKEKKVATKPKAYQLLEWSKKTYTMLEIAQVPSKLRSNRKEEDD